MAAVCGLSDSGDRAVSSVSQKANVPYVSVEFDRLRAYRHRSITVLF